MFLIDPQGNWILYLIFYGSILQQSSLIRSHNSVLLLDCLSSEEWTELILLLTWYTESHTKIGIFRCPPQNVPINSILNGALIRNMHKCHTDTTSTGMGTFSQRNRYVHDWSSLSLPIMYYGSIKVTYSIPQQCSRIRLLVSRRRMDRIDSPFDLIQTESLHKIGDI